jgi:hypothetical protein
MDDAEDEQLATRAQTGDRQTFTLLVRRYQERVFRFILRMNGARDEAMDLTQEITAAPRPHDKPRPTRWWGLLPVSIGAAASIGIGVIMGAALFGGAAAMPRVTAMSVFDTLPPGGLCLGPQSCYSKGSGFPCAARCQ